MTDNSNDIVKDQIEMKLRFIKERETHIANNLTAYYTRASIILTSATILISILAFIIVINLHLFWIFMIPFIVLGVLILGCTKFIFPFNFKEYKKYGLEEKDDLSNKEYSKLLDSSFEMKLEHFLAKMTKHAIQRTKRGKDFKIICYLYVIFVIELIVSFFLIFFYSVFLLSNVIGTICIVITIQITIIVIYTIIILIIDRKIINI
ncbi:MAG: hypothetical protein ACTSRB_09285 [Candidatus Helarchaeota archaeon]